jgi:hypothetical protein
LEQRLLDRFNGGAWLRHLIGQSITKWKREIDFSFTKSNSKNRNSVSWIEN